MNKKGFTLVEILVVIAIIGAIIIVIVPSIFAINKRINKRLFESKKELILVAAKQYGKDNSDIFNENGEAIITVNTLLENGYIEFDVKNGKDNCEYNYGCVINPVDDSILNLIPILITKSKNKFNAFWNETASGDVPQNFLVVVCNKLSIIKGKDENNDVCSCSIVDGKARISTNARTCYFTTNDPDNWLYHDEIYFRIMGLESADSINYYVKVVTENNI